jgi:transposase-like protein
MKMMNKYKGLTEIKAKKIEMLGLNEIKEKKKHKFNGISREYFVYYLKEFEFRYNFRANLDGILYNVLAGIKRGITLFYDE